MNASRPLIGIPCRRGRHENLAIWFNLQSYCDAIAAAGGAPVLLPLFDEEGTHADVLDRLDGLLLAGGGDLDPASYGQDVCRVVEEVDNVMDRIEIALIRRAMEAGLPILAICRGEQVLNVALGGTLHQDIGTQVPESLRHQRKELPRPEPSHEVRFAPGTRLAAIVGTETSPVNSLHHQAVDRLGQGLIASAIAPDGIIEAIEHTGPAFILGVQWHPEEMWRHDPRWAALFDAFVVAMRPKAEL